MWSELPGWLPVELREDTGDCLWRYVGNTKFTAPFFAGTLARCLSLPENSSGPPRITRLEEVLEIARGLDAVVPSAFIFHVSRCGSTLVSQLLGLDDSCVVLSEVRFFDQLLRARFRPRLAGLVDLAAQLPAAVRLYARRRTGHERHLVIKLDSWHIRFHAELRALYPQTPFILLYRHPAAVLHSHRKHPGMHATHGVLEHALFGLEPEESTNQTRATYLPRVLAFYYRTFLAIARTDARSRLVAYQPEMAPVVESIARFAGIELPSGHEAKMRARAMRHGKYPGEIFHSQPVDFGEESWQLCVGDYEALEQWRARSEQ